MKKTAFLLSCTLLVLGGCIRNDLDYPYVFGGFTDFIVEGAKSVDIDNNTRTVTLDLEEGADLDHLKVTGYKLTEKAVLSEEIPEYLDLTEPYAVEMKTYQTFGWTIRATQNIVRYVNCDRQAGDAAINADKRTVILSVTDEQPLASIRFTGMKLGPEGSRITSTTGTESTFEESKVVTREITSFPVTLDCVLERTFDVEFKGKTTTWSLKAVQITVDKQVQNVRSWCHKAEIRAVFSGRGTAGLEYRRGSATIWSEVPDVKVAGVGLSATLTGLDADTDYLVRVVEDGEYSEEFAFHTYAEVQIYNMNMDAWHQVGKIWYPYPENATASQKVWDTANKATANFAGGSNTTPDPSFVYAAGAGKNSVRMESIYAVVQFAGGNIFIGQFLKLVGLGVELAHGVPFATRPVALHGYYAYIPRIIDYADEDHKEWLGKEDFGQLQVILADWDDQYHVYSAKKQFIDFKNDPCIIGEFSAELPNTQGQWKEFTIPINYRDDRTPAWAVIISASSYYANFYTGAKGSILWLDEMEFVYE